MNQSEIVAKPSPCRAATLVAEKLFTCIQDHCDGTHHVYAKS